MKGTATLVLFTLFISSIYSQCTYTNSATGETFDFSGLTLEDSSNTHFYNATYSNGDIFYWNICGTVSSKYCTKTWGTSVCQNSAGVEWNCGLFSTQRWSSGVSQNGESYISVTYSGGDTCTGQTGQPKRSTVIGLYCGDGGNTVFGESACTYQLKMATKYACPGGVYYSEGTQDPYSEGGGIEVGWVGFAITIILYSVLLSVVCFFVGFAIGTFLKWKKNGYACFCCFEINSALPSTNNFGYNYGNLQKSTQDQPDGSKDWI